MSKRFVRAIKKELRDDGAETKSGTDTNAKATESPGENEGLDLGITLAKSIELEMKMTREWREIKREIQTMEQEILRMLNREAFEGVGGATSNII